MKNLFSKIMVAFLGASLVIGLAVSFSKAKNIEKAQAIGNYSTDASTYYNSITATSGTQLAAQLHDLITSTHRYYTSYDDNGSNGYQKNTDRYYENGVAQSGYIYEFYSGVKWPDAWSATAGSTTGGYNREHCWCQSNSVNTSGTQMWGTTGGGADMHHLRPAEVRLNSTRSNNEYGEISNRDSYKVYAKFGTNATYALGGYNSGGTFEPLDSKKGDVARIILYVYLHYNSYSVTTLFGSHGTTNGSGSSSYFSTSLLSLTKITNQSTEAKALEMLLSWNTSDPVDEIEQRRNEQVATYQGNRNPFIDNSGYADDIWGGGSSEPRVNSVSVSPSSLSLDLNGTTSGTLSATVNVSNGAPTTVNWTSSNTNVATVSSSGVVTAKAKGSCTVTATSTYNSNKSASASISVADSSGGGGGGGSSTGDFTWNLAIASYDANPTANSVTWSHSYATMEAIRTDSSKTAANNYLGGDANNRTSSRFYTGNALQITPATNYTITSIVFTATSNNYASALGNSTWTNASASASTTTVTVTPTNGANVISATIGGTCGFTSVVVYYSTESAGTSPLTSITLNTSNVQTEFYSGDTFDYSGLVVTAHYENGTEDIVTPSNVSTPNMSTVGDKTVTVTYTENAVTKTATYTITILSAEITAIYASVNKTFHPGDSISTSDIYVEDNLGNEVTGFTFANNGYQFTYNDAASGGSLTNKEFNITYSELQTTLVVQVQRKAYETPTGTASWNKVTDASDLEIGDMIIIADSGNNLALSDEQRNSNRGAVSVTKSNNTISWTTGEYVPQQLTLTSTSGISSAPSGSFGLSTGSGFLYAASSNANHLKTQKNNDINGAFVITITDGVTRIEATASSNRGQIRSNYNNNPSIFSCYATNATTGNTTEIYKKVESGNETALNVANYIMYEDTNNQCETKFSVAKGYFEGLTAAQRETFMTSSDYVISTARTRLQAWATHLGKTITYSNGDYVISNSHILNPIIDTSNSESLSIIIAISLLAVTGVVGYFYFQRKEEK